MRFTDIFIRRPVLSTVVSLLILILGLAGFSQLSVRQYPKLTNTIITITTSYPGASGALIQGFITTPLSQAIGSADGIDYLTATSTEGTSTITAYIRLDYDPSAAMTNVTAKVDSVTNLLPKGSFSPVIDEETGDNFPALFINFSSSKMNARQISAYLTNVIMPKIYSVGGISKLQLWGGQTYAMRLWLDNKRMAGLGITSSDVLTALENQNVQAAPGQLEGPYTYINLSANTGLESVAQFNSMVIKKTASSLIHLKDIGYAQLGSQTDTSSASYEGKPAVFLTIRTAPTANPLVVVNNIKTLLPQIEKNFPQGLTATMAYDSTIFVRASISEVIKAIIEAALIVTVVIFLFLGAWRSVIIPTLTIPLSLVGVCLLLYLMGFSINLLTLLAMVIAIGLVVDDAIIILENVHRYIEQGESPINAALIGTRQIAAPIIVMTLTLAAVFAPIGFIGGVTGALFKEFVFTLAATVIISGVIALTFSPMLCSRLMKPKANSNRLLEKIDHAFAVLQRYYRNTLHVMLNYRFCVLLSSIAVLISCYFLYSMIPAELAPQEDQGYVGIVGTAPVSANLAYLQKFGAQFQPIFDSISQQQSAYTVFGFPTGNKVLGGIVLKPWDERELSANQLQTLLQEKISAIAGLQMKAYQRPSLPGVAMGPPVNFVLLSTAGATLIESVMQQLLSAARKSGLFLVATNNVQFNNPQLNINIDRAKAADIGIDMDTVSATLSTLVGEGYINYFDMQGYSYQVIPQLSQSYRMTTQNLQNIMLKTTSGVLVPLSSIANFSASTRPSELDQFQQLNSDTLQAVLMPNVTLGTALSFLQQTVEKILPSNMGYDYDGASRQFMEEGSTIMYAFGLAIIIIFLLLAAQFESFRDPFIILCSVPMSIFGALLPLFLGAGTINIYTQIGLVALIGLITKHGILIVEFANKLQAEQGLGARDAVEQAAAIRLRPILMTTLAMVFGVVPLIIATGAGAVSRFDIGLVIACGMAVGTCFTLFVVPTFYTYIHK